MGPLALAVASLAVLGLLAALVLAAYLPKGPQLKLSGWPHPAWLYLQAGVTLLTKRKGGRVSSKGAKAAGGASQAIIEVSLPAPTRFSPSRLAGFLRLTGHEGGTAGATPLMYPIVESFRLTIQAMLLPDFPFNVLGSVLARNSTTLYRAVAVDEQLSYKVQIDPSTFRTTPKGDTEVDLVSTATSKSDGQLVWRSSLTAIILSPNRRKPAPGSAPAPAPEPLPSREVIATWRLGSDTGRRYGALNGDLNPIHLYPATSRLFGFKRPIAHALFLVARAEASLRNKGVQPAYPALFESEFKRPTLLPATLQCAWGPAAGAGSMSPEAISAALAPGGPGLPWAVLTEDGAKEVIVGRLATLKKP